MRMEFKADRSMKLGDFLGKECGISRRMLIKLKKTPGGITCLGKTIRTVDRVSQGDVIVLEWEDESTLEPNSNIRVPVAFENENVVVFNKPTGMPVHPSAGHRDDTLGNFFAYRYPGLTFRPVNRLDRDTSGLCLAAKSAPAAAALQGNIHKIYYAVAEGMISHDGVIDAPIARERESVIKRTVRADGRRAVTHYRVIGGSGKYTLLEIRLETGRTHQIRVHFAHIGHPLAGDDLYGGSREDIECQALHCGQLVFNDPVSGRSITVSSDIRSDMKGLVEQSYI